MSGYEINYEVPTMHKYTNWRTVTTTDAEEALSIANKCEDLGYNYYINPCWVEEY